MEDTGPRTWHIRDFYSLLPETPRGSVRSGLRREVKAGLLARPYRRSGLYLRRDAPPLWDPLFHYENLRVRAKQGARGSPRVPLLALLAQRFGTVVEEVLDERNLGYHFSGLFDTLERVRDVTISVYPEVTVIALGSRGEPLRFWELFVFLVGWVPGVTGIPVPAWELRQLEVNRDHVLDEDVGPLWALSRPIPLARAVKAMVKVYTKEEGIARAEVRLSGEISTDVLLDDVRAMLEWSGRLDR